MERATHVLLGAARIALGWVFLWAFLDKLFGFGYATARDSAWFRGGSPTSGFLNFANPDGPMAGFFKALDSTFTEWLFMLGLLGIGVALVLGIGMRIASISGTLLLVLMWLALLPVENNPFLDDHLVYALVLLLLASLRAGDHIGFGKWWREQGLVQRAPWLE